MHQDSDRMCNQALRVEIIKVTMINERGNDSKSKGVTDALFILSLHFRCGHLNKSPGWKILNLRLCPVFYYHLEKSEAQ